MLRKSLVSRLVAAALFMPSLAHGQLIDDLLNINDILSSLCGQRMIVLWVDETERSAPCIAAYSATCVEAQGPQSCSPNAETLAVETEHIQAVNAASAK